MSAARVLLERLAETATSLSHGGYLLVLDGEGFENLPEVVALPTGPPARVVRVDSELALRHALWKARGAGVVVLVPEGLELSADLLLRAHNKRVHTISGDEVLTALLGFRVTGADDHELRALAIEHAAQIQARLHDRTRPTVVDRTLLERTLVEVVAELQDLRASRIELGEVLARWIATPPRWAPVIRRLAATTLAQLHGDAGRAVGWALEEPEARFHALLVHGALLGVEGEVPAAAWGLLESLGREEGSPLRAPRAARDVLAAVARDAAVRLGHAARPYLDEADQIARRLLPSSQLQTSFLLPLAFEERAHAIATQLSNGEIVPRASFRHLRAHVLAQTAGRELELLDDMDRLARYLRQPRRPSGGVQLAMDYLLDHAHADRAARRVERALASVRTHHAEARSLLAKVRAARDALNETWARGLVEDYTKILFDRNVVALQNLVRDDVVDRVAGKGVFLLVLDGCSVPVFLDLLDQLVHPRHRIGLEVERMALRYRAGLSPLPTITSHARGAIFLGAVPKDPFALETTWRDEGERQTDPARFQQNPALGALARRLFLKGELADGGAALQTALKGPIPLVAAVFNAVDDRIGSHDTGAAWRLEVEDVAGLLPALHAALDAGRKVIVTADHGHTPFRGTENRVGAGTPRYARLEKNEVAPDGFLEIDCGELSGEPGRTAFAWRSGAYRGSVQVGFHGGCSLEEMVVPVAWLARDGVGADLPAWWFDAAEPQEAVPKVSPLPPLPPMPAPPRPMPLPFVTTAPLDRLPRGLRVVLEEDAQRAVAWILADGPIRTSVLAQRVGRPSARVAGWLAKLNRKLAEHGARLDSETLPDHEQQWRYVGPEEGR